MEQIHTTETTQFGAPDAPFCNRETARFTIIPAPLEYSVCYMEGTRHGPQAILNASSQMELYDEELDCCPIEVGVYTHPVLNYQGMDHAAALHHTGEAVREVLERHQIPLTLGGEHSLSAPIIAEVYKKYPDLTVVHIDAHGDLRDEYEGTPLSHASIERRVVDMGIPLLEIGIRSFSPEEAAFLKTGPNVAVVWAYKIARGLASIPWERLSQHTYVTIDLDAIDPSEMPAVGTPEPGGLSWYQVLDLFKEICQRTTVVGMDVVELCPMEGQTRADFLAAKLVYKLIGYHSSIK
ncbi:agmatinase [Tengunoibacter tsumagoiensis]|uniref:Agmatinase n=1 Tax=Tengunoibacter tsumagoiensis TaxID=2014871 RepID=A0A401ZYG4_9CHLR|nr:agmatinase [Tengunoibacter tsumagoiensis]GCE11885.1 agmatinase [Tengunoibacter tsumagoiensis]